MPDRTLHFSGERPDDEPELDHSDPTRSLRGLRQVIFFMFVEIASTRH